MEFPEKKKRYHIDTLKRAINYNIAATSEFNEERRYAGSKISLVFCQHKDVDPLK